MLAIVLRRMGRRLSAGEAGFTIVELTVALVVLTTGLLGMIAGFDSANKISLVSERHATMTHIAERELERVEGIPYSHIGLSTNPTAPDFTPAHSTDTGNPDYYVTNGSPPTVLVDRSGTATEQLDLDGAGQVQHYQTETDGNETYNVYDYVTWVQDAKCSPGCSGTQNYKRVIVAVSVASGLKPAPVYSQSVIADPAATPPGSCANANCSNPISSATTYCQDANGNTIQCNSGISAGNTNTWYLHDCLATAASCPIPGADHTTTCTVAPCNPQQCPAALVGGLLGNTAGCPTPDKLDSNPPTSSCTTGCTGSGGDPTPCYHYSSDLGILGYTCGLLLNPSSTSCSSNSWSNSLLNVQSHMWVGSPVTADTTLTGDGALSMFSQLQQGSASANAVVTLCIALYDIPPTNNVVGSLADILLSGFQPSVIGGATYTPATDPSTGTNWPTAGPTQTSFTFRFLSSPTSVYVVPVGHRLGIRVWVNVNVNAAVNLLYDNPNYPSFVELNSQ